jgi:hypothetical protein
LGRVVRRNQRQNNTGWGGLVVANGGRARADGVVTQGNWNGAYIYDGGLLQFDASSTSRNNIAEGIFVSQGTLLCKPCTVTGNGLGNGADGIHLEWSSSVSFRGGSFSVTGNGGVGISLSNLSGARFGVGGNISGNLGAWDLVCNPTFTTAAGLANVPGARVTGCP